MPISYDKLWKLLIDKKMNRTDLKDASGISFNVLAKMGKNEFVSIHFRVCFPQYSLLLILPMPVVPSDD